MNFRFVLSAGPLIVLASLTGCGDKPSSSTSDSAPSGFDSQQKQKYENLTPEGKAYVSEQMKEYEKSKK